MPNIGILLVGKLLYLITPSKFWLICTAAHLMLFNIHGESKSSSLQQVADNRGNESNLSMVKLKSRLVDVEWRIAGYI